MDNGLLAALAVYLVIGVLIVRQPGTRALLFSEFLVTAARNPDKPVRLRLMRAAVYVGLISLWPLLLKR